MGERGQGPKSPTSTVDINQIIPNNCNKYTHKTDNKLTIPKINKTYIDRIKKIINSTKIQEKVY